MLNVRTIALLCFAFSISVTPSAVAAQSQPDNHPLAIYREAGASKDQQGQINALAREFESEAKVKAERAMNLLKRMQDFTLDPMPDEKVVLATQDEINALQADLATSRVKMMIRIRSILNNDQRQKLVDILKQRRAAQQQQQQQQQQSPRR